MPRKKKAIDAPVFYTTFDIARKLGVSPPTVVNWITNGLLVAHRTPGGHRRIPREELIAFARAQNYPLDLEAAPAPPAAQERVLVVDDDVDFCDLLRAYIQSCGPYTVDVAHSGFSAGLLLARQPPDAIIMDIQMPDMNGFEVLHMIRQDPQVSHVPVIACTSSGREVEEQIRQHSFQGFIRKPFKFDELLTMIAQVARAARAEAQRGG